MSGKRQRIKRETRNGTISTCRITIVFGVFKLKVEYITQTDFLLYKPLQDEVVIISNIKET